MSDPVIVSKINLGDVIPLTMISHTTIWTKLENFVVTEWKTFEADAAYGLNSALEVTKQLIVNFKPRVWIVLQDAVMKAWSDASHLDFSGIVPDVVMTLESEGLQVGVDFFVEEISALVTLLTKRNTITPQSVATVLGLKIIPGDLPPLPRLGELGAAAQGDANVEGVA